MTDKTPPRESNPPLDLGRLWFDAGMSAGRIHWPEVRESTWEEIQEKDRLFMVDAAKGFLALAAPPEVSPAPASPGAGDLEIRATAIIQSVQTQGKHPQVAAMEVLRMIRAATPQAHPPTAPADLESLKAELEEEKTARLSAEYALESWLGVHKDFVATWKAEPAPAAPLVPAAPWTRSREDIQSYDGNGDPVVFLYPPDESKERIAIRGLDCQETAKRLLAALNGA